MSATIAQKNGEFGTPLELAAPASRSRASRSRGSSADRGTGSCTPSTRNRSGANTGPGRLRMHREQEREREHEHLGDAEDEDVAPELAAGSSGTSTGTPRRRRTTGERRRGRPPGERTIRIAATTKNRTVLTTATQTLRRPFAAAEDPRPAVAPAARAPRVEPGLPARESRRPPDRSSPARLASSAATRRSGRCASVSSHSSFRSSSVPSACSSAIAWSTQGTNGVALLECQPELLLLAVRGSGTARPPCPRTRRTRSGSRRRRRRSARCPGP